MKKYITGFITGALLVIVFLLFLGAIKNQNEVGTYQISTSYREPGNWVFITKIDTRTGEIVELTRYNGFDSYKEME